MRKTLCIVVNNFVPQDTNNKAFKPLTVLILTYVVLICATLIYFINTSYFTPEAKANTVVNNYLEAIMNGDMTGDYKKA